MNVELTYPGLDPLQIPDQKLLGVYDLPREPPTDPFPVLLGRALDEPWGAPPLRRLARGKRRVVILSDDYTRTTPVRQILPAVLDELADAGVPADAVTILLALGTHRPMTEDEIGKKLGRQVIDSCRIVNHNWRDSASLADLGCTESGIPVLINRIVVEADLLIGLGHVVPHRVAGFSGGGKIVQPGVCGAETTGRTHWLSSLMPFDSILGRRDNLVRCEIDAIARRAGLAFIVNMVQNSAGEVIGVFAGDPVSAHRKACIFSRKACSVRIPRRADVVVVEACPADADVWQAVKALFPAALALKPGGTIVLVSPCSEGISHQHPELLTFGYRPVPEIRRLQATGAIGDLSAAAHLAHVGEIVDERASVLFATPGVSQEQAAQLHVGWVGSPQEGVDRTLRTLDDATVCVLRHGAELLPLMDA